MYLHVVLFRGTRKLFVCRASSLGGNSQWTGWCLGYSCDHGCCFCCLLHHQVSQCDHITVNIFSCNSHSVQYWKMCCFGELSLVFDHKYWWMQKKCTCHNNSRFIQNIQHVILYLLPHFLSLFMWCLFSKSGERRQPALENIPEPQHATTHSPIISNLAMVRGGHMSTFRCHHSASACQLLGTTTWSQLVQDDQTVPFTRTLIQMFRSKKTCFLLVTWKELNCKAILLTRNQDPFCLLSKQNTQPNFLHYASL